ncbi:unnamed protein product [Adineta ricciae]|uniref:Uncharacterized protein n=1 Tax=Adineta ricciae TaxID=249248 RepID=A0A813VJD3_ADIRI|nr:unnamed protein product [Adineta ricciae]
MVSLFIIILVNKNSTYHTILTRPVYTINEALKQELINEHLLSYSQFYNSSSYECKIKSNDGQLEKKLNAAARLLPTLRRNIIPYPNDYFHGRGIVLTVGKYQLPFAKVNLEMIQHTRTRLPVQIWYSSQEIQDDDVADLLIIAPQVNLSICCFLQNRCRNITRTWQINSQYVFKPNITSGEQRFAYKPAAIISSAFAEVLFLDSDAYLTRDPEELFLHDPMYLHFGTLFFPDAHISRQHSSVWKLFNTSCGENEFELDSAAILVDKRRAWKGLFITKLMNDNYQHFYGGISDGDKDTFRFGFRYVNVKYYIVMIPCATGQFNGSHFCGLTLCKTDSLAQHIYINHIHIFKYEGVSYTSENLEYTRIGLGDPNNHSYFFMHCRLPGGQTSCFHIIAQPNPEVIPNFCYMGGISLKDIEDYKYQSNEALLFDRSRYNRIILTKTNNVMPHFIENLIKSSHHL